MLSRRTALRIAEACIQRFSVAPPRSTGLGRNLLHGDLYDFMFEHDLPSWFCQKFKATPRPRDAQERIMLLHTGDTQAIATVGWTHAARLELGQRLLEQVAEALLNQFEGAPEYGTSAVYRAMIDEMYKSLQIDGYSYARNRLLRPDRDATEVAEAHSVLTALHEELALGERDTALHHLRLSAEHYIESRWDDSIGNSRKWLESVLEEVAVAHSARMRGVAGKKFDTPGKVRQYLENEGLLEKAEAEALAKVYGLLSETGGHPYMARSDQARLLRDMALTFSEFAMRRLKGALNSD